MRRERIAREFVSLPMTLFCRHTLCMSRKRGEGRTQIVRKAPKTYGAAFAKIKQKIPSQHCCWDRKLPAVPPGLTRLLKRALFSRTDIRGSLLTEKSAPSPILRRKGKAVSARPQKSIRPDAFRRARTNTRLSAGKEGRPTHSSSTVWQNDTTPAARCQERGEKKFQRFKAMGGLIRFPGSRAASRRFVQGRRGGEGTRAAPTGEMTIPPTSLRSATPRSQA